MIRDASQDDQHYHDFYLALGERVPETETAHHNMSRSWSRYATVMHELRKLARPDRTLLDIGCSDGVYTIPWRVMDGGRAVGVDIAPGFIERAKQAAEQRGVNNVDFVTRDIQQEPLDDLGHFDVVLFSEVLEHLNHPDLAMKSIRNRLEEGGVLVLSTPTPVAELMISIEPRLRYLRGLLSGRLKEEQVVNSDSRPYLVAHDLGGYLYRHDAYWPTKLPSWVESFGFQTVHFYTGGLGWPFAKINALQYLEAHAVRRIPLLNLFGKTNFGVFKAV